MAIKAWNLYNTDNTDVVLVEDETTETPVALDYVDYGGSNPIINRECDIALEQQANDFSDVEEGLSGSGMFDPNTDPQNNSGTYKRLVYDQIYRAFYNSYANPTEIFGLDYIDFPLSKTSRNLADMFLVFTVPQDIFGDRILAGSVQFFDTSLDDNAAINDDGNGNLIAGTYLFSKIQEIRSLGNTLLPGTGACGNIIPAPTASCMNYLGFFEITSSNPSPTNWNGRAYPSFICVSTSSIINTLVASDNFLAGNDNLTHNRHNWFFDTVTYGRYNDYTSSYVHTVSGRNSVFVNNKYFMLDDGTQTQIPGNTIPIGALNLLEFDYTGSLLSTCSLAYGGRDLDTDGNVIYVFETDGAALRIEEIDPNTNTSIVVNIIGDLSFTAEASLGFSTDFTPYFGKIFSFVNNARQSWQMVNDLGASADSGDTLFAVYNGSDVSDGYNLNMGQVMSIYGGWMGSFVYSPVTDTYLIGAYSGSPNFAPLILETDKTLTVIYTYDLSAYTGSINPLFEFNQLIYNAANGTVEALDYYQHQMLVIDPAAHTVVCQLNVAGEIPTGSLGFASAADASGNIYVCQQRDGPYSSSYTGSIKIFGV